MKKKKLTKPEFVLDMCYLIGLHYPLDENKLNEFLDKICPDLNKYYLKRIK